MTANLAKWASNDGQIIKLGLSDGRGAKFVPSVVGIAYDLLLYECYLGNVGLRGVGPAPSAFAGPRVGAWKGVSREAGRRRKVSRTCMNAACRQKLSDLGLMSPQ